MNLMVLTCAVFPSEEIARRKLWIFLKSCERFGIEPRLYGIGKRFPGYRAMKLDYQLEWLKEHASEATHVLYTDAWDAFFLASLSEIERKYQALGAPPILTSASLGLANCSDEEVRYPNCFDHSILYRYPHVGGYIAEVPAIIEAFERMEKTSGDDCFSWFDAWRDGWFRPQLDSECRIFQVEEHNLLEEGNRVVNAATHSYPCVLHLPGGYCDPETGKDERMVPWAARMGVI
jgi:hypothetical protein